jgi:hypothetical protein
MVEFDLENTEFNQILYDTVIGQWSVYSDLYSIFEENKLKIFGEEISCSVSTSIIFFIPKRGI